LSRRKMMNNLPDKRYSVIYADPPWSYRDRSMNRGGSARHYETLLVKDVMLLPVQRISASDCMLFLWTTCPILPVALSVMTAWGFSYRTVAFVWVKTTGKGDLAWGMGHWTRANAELCLLGINGKPKRVSAGVHQVVMSRRLEHSRKPAEVRDLIVQLAGDVPRIELFARERVPGWDAWGKEV